MTDRQTETIARVSGVKKSGLGGGGGFFFSLGGGDERCVGAAVGVGGWRGEACSSERVGRRGGKPLRDAGYYCSALLYLLPKK